MCRAQVRSLPLHLSGTLFGHEARSLCQTADAEWFAFSRSRPQFIHKYTLTSQSIYSAVSVGLTGEHILNKLRIFSKLKIPVPVKSFVSKTAEACGTVQMALVKGRYYVESESQAALLVLLNEPKNQILEAARRVLGTGGARLTPLDLIRTKEVNYNEVRSGVGYSALQWWHLRCDVHICFAAAAYASAATTYACN